MKDMPELIWEGYKGNGEPYGFFNLESSVKYGRMGEERPDTSIVGVNPCAEIPLSNRESCNLSEIYLPMVGSKEELIDVACLLYKVQKAVAALSYLDPASDKITSQNMRLGLGVTGVAQALDRVDWLDDTYKALRELDSAWSAERGWPESVRLTTVKPSGTLSLLPGVTPGVHPGFSQYFVKRMRMASSDILVNYCKSKGYFVEPLRNFDGSQDPRTVVVEFPCKFPEGTVLAEDMTAIDQMDLVRKLQRVWADNAVSVTVYYKPEELEGIQDYLKEHWSEMKSVSFLLHSEHGFDQAPMGELLEEDYLKILETTTPLGEKLSGSTIMTDDDMALLDECATGACPIR
jgi:ribonucleotide reductase alpha subunit